MKRWARLHKKQGNFIARGRACGRKKEEEHLETMDGTVPVFNPTAI
jgi:hypothetical protein